MIKAVRHVGIVVRDLNKSLQFYQDFLGLKIWKREIEIGPYIDKVVGIENVKVEWVKLKTADNFIIELLQYHSHPDNQHATSVIPSNKIGCSHVAFSVEDVDQAYNKLIRLGYHCNAAPELSPNGVAKVMYCHDADGTILELVEEVK